MDRQRIASRYLLLGFVIGFSMAFIIAFAVWRAPGDVPLDWCRARLEEPF